MALFLFSVLCVLRMQRYGLQGFQIERRMKKLKKAWHRLKLGVLALGICGLAAVNKLEAKPMHLDSVKLHIPFYGNLNDWSGWNNNGVVDTLHFTADRNGAPNRALRLNENNPNLRVRATFLSTNTYSFLFWYRFPQMPTDTVNWMTLGNADCRQQILAAPHGTDSLHIVFRSDSQSLWRSFDFFLPYEQAKWNHFTWMKSADSVYAFYNAFFRFEAALPFQVCAEPDSLVIGQTDPYAVQHLDIDEVRWYSENIEPSTMLSLYIGERSNVAMPLAEAATLYPNPVRDFLHYESTFPPSTINLYDIQGRLMHAWKSPADKGVLDLSELESGSYMLQFSGEQGQRITQKILVGNR